MTGHYRHTGPRGINQPEVCVHDQYEPEQGKEGRETKSKGKREREREREREKERWREREREREKVRVREVLRGAVSSTSAMKLPSQEPDPC